MNPLTTFGRGKLSHCVSLNDSSVGTYAVILEMGAADVVYAARLCCGIDTIEYGSDSIARKYTCCKISLSRFF